jgi:hypothetical protein
MSSQPDLPLFQPVPDDPNVRWFVGFLRDHRDWIRARELVALIEQRAGRVVDDRQIRLWAEAAGPDIISGQRGYRHADHATIEESRRFVAWLESQAKKMIARAETFRRRLHARFG